MVPALFVWNQPTRVGGGPPPMNTQNCNWFRAQSSRFRRLIRVKSSIVYIYKATNITQPHVPRRRKVDVGMVSISRHI